MNTTQIDNTDKDQLQKYIVQMGIDVNDPIFNVYAQIGETQTLLQRLPKEISDIVGGWNEMVDQKLKFASHVALQEQETAIAKAAKDLIKSTKASMSVSFSLSNFKLAQVAGAIGIVLALGVGIGAFVFSLAHNNSQKASSLSKSDAQLLEWARSKEGKIARELYSKNSAIINGCAANSPKLKGICLIDINGFVTKESKK
ncbi:MAG: hypothetical protein HC815_05610 [Richelia sp. RM1_1_1]|nr:hypothetical protein [Richelia sp. RM1_1_1]